MQLQQRNKYLETAVQTASPAQLLIILYDGAIRFCRSAVESMKTQNYADASVKLTKAQNIISEFIITIDHKSPIADNLIQLYHYFNDRLREANFKKDHTPIEEVLSHLIELKETWIQTAKQFNQINGGTNAPAAPASRSIVI